jgi:hypothetical protein
LHGRFSGHHTQISYLVALGHFFDFGSRLARQNFGGVIRLSCGGLFSVKSPMYDFMAAAYSSAL